MQCQALARHTCTYVCIHRVIAQASTHGVLSLFLLALHCECRQCLPLQVPQYRGEPKTLTLPPLHRDKQGSHERAFQALPEGDISLTLDRRLSLAACSSLDAASHQCLYLFGWELL